MAQVRRSARANIDLRKILLDLEDKNPDVADRYSMDFEKKFEALTLFPEIGRLRPDIGPEVRSTLVHPYVFFYRVEGDLVEIIRILHGQQNLAKIMQRELR